MQIAELYDRHGAAAYAVALRITADPSRAAEIVTDVFRAFARGMELPGHQPEAGLIRAVRDLALSRREGRNRAADVVVMDGSPRSIVEAAFFEGCSIAEIARLTSLPVEEVRQRLRDGMAALRENRR